MSNCYSVMTMEDAIACNKKDADKLRKMIDGTDDHGVSVEYNDGKLYLFAEESFSLDDIPKKAIKLIGRIAGKAGLEFVGFGVAWYSDRQSPSSSGGHHFRIYADGALVEAKVVWPEDVAWKCPECNKAISDDYEALVDVGNPVCGDCDCDMEKMDSDEAREQGVH